MEPSNGNTWFSKKSNDEINKAVEGTTHQTNMRSKRYVGKQFREFCAKKSYFAVIPLIICFSLVFRIFYTYWSELEVISRSRHG